MQQPHSFLALSIMDFMIGGVAGAGATIFTNPMDVVKTRLQLQGELKARSDQNTRYRGMVHALYMIWKMDGTLALQKGLAPAMLLGFCMNSFRLGIYRMADVQGWMRTEKGDIHVPHAMFWAALSGGISGVAANPASVVKTRIQSEAHPSIAVGRQHRYKGTCDAFSTIYHTEGLRGFFAGVRATCSRVAVASMAQLTSFSVAKEVLLSHGVVSEGSPLTLAFGASLLSGVLVALAMSPLDVVTSRLYNQGSAKMKGGLLYTGVIDCLTKIYKTEGLHGLYKGLGPLYLRLAPQTTISFVLWDMLNNAIRGKNENDVQEKQVK